MFGVFVLCVLPFLQSTACLFVLIRRNIVIVLLLLQRFLGKIVIITILLRRMS